MPNELHSFTFASFASSHPREIPVLLVLLDLLAKTDQREFVVMLDLQGDMEMLDFVAHPVHKARRESLERMDHL